MFEQSQKILNQNLCHYGLESLQKLYSSQFHKIQDYQNLQNPIIQNILDWDQIQLLYLKKSQSHDVFKSIHKSKYGPFDENEQYLLELSVNLLSLQTGIKPPSFSILEWEQISEIIFNRHWKNCRSSWLKMQSQPLSKNAWSIDEDKYLQDLYYEAQRRDQIISWNQIAVQLSQKINSQYIRRGKQCRERWMNYLNPDIERSKWTKNDEIILLNYILEYGKQWTLISKKHFEGRRTENCIKNRYHSIIKRKENKNMVALLQRNGNYQNPKQLEKCFIKALIKQLLEDSQSETNNFFNQSHKFRLMELEKIDSDISLCLITKTKICQL